MNKRPLAIEFCSYFPLETGRRISELARECIESFLEI